MKQPAGLSAVRRRYQDIPSADSLVRQSACPGTFQTKHAKCKRVLKQSLEQAPDRGRLLVRGRDTFGRIRTGSEDRAQLNAVKTSRSACSRNAVLSADDE